MNYKVLVYLGSVLINEHSVKFEEEIKAGDLINIKGDLLFVNNAFSDTLMTKIFNGKIKNSL